MKYVIDSSLCLQRAKVLLSKKLELGSVFVMQSGVNKEVAIEIAKAMRPGMIMINESRPDVLSNLRPYTKVLLPEKLSANRLENAIKSLVPRVVLIIHQNIKNLANIIKFVKAGQIIYLETANIGIQQTVLTNVKQNVIVYGVRYSDLVMNINPCHNYAPTHKISDEDARKFALATQEGTYVYIDGMTSNTAIRTFVKNLISSTITYVGPLLSEAKTKIIAENLNGNLCLDPFISECNAISVAKNLNPNSRVMLHPWLSQQIARLVVENLAENKQIYFYEPNYKGVNPSAHLQDIVSRLAPNITVYINPKMSKASAIVVAKNLKSEHKLFLEADLEFSTLLEVLQNCPSNIEVNLQETNLNHILQIFQNKPMGSRLLFHGADQDYINKLQRKHYAESYSPSAIFSTIEHYNKNREQQVIVNINYYLDEYDSVKEAIKHALNDSGDNIKLEIDLSKLEEGIVKEVYENLPEGVEPTLILQQNNGLFSTDYDKLPEDSVFFGAKIT